MSDILIEVESGKSKRLKTANKLCKDDIVVTGTGGSGGGDNPLRYANNPPKFMGVTFPEDYELVLNIPFDFNDNVPTLSCLDMFRATKGCKKIKFIGNEKGFPFSIRYMFFQNNGTEIFDISEFKFVPNDVTGGFQQTSLKSIIGKIDSTYYTTGSFGFSTSLVDVGFVPNTIKYSISFGSCLNLSADSIQSIIDGLADLTGGTAQTLTFHATVKGKLTDQQIATITGKNWSLA